MGYVCRWIKDDTIEGGRYFVPGCWPGAMAREGDERAMCVCNKRKAKADLLQRVESLERTVQELAKTISKTRPF